jgi:hypothetical protein
MVKSRKIIWTGHVVNMWKRRSGYRLLVGKLDRKRPLGRPRRRWENNIKMYQATEWLVVDWIDWVRMEQVAGSLKTVMIIRVS